jgi:hypothetical protein
MSGGVVVKKKLDFVLKFLVNGQFLKSDLKHFDLNGIKLREKLINQFTSGRTDLHLVDAKLNPLDEIRPGRNVIQIPDSKEGPVFENNQIKAGNPVKCLSMMSDITNVAMNYQNYLRSRRLFWKSFMVNPSVIISKEYNARSSDPQAKIEAKIEDLSLIPVELETIRMLENNEIPSNSRLFETQFDPDAGTMIILMDSVRKRLFSTSTRLAIASKLAPIQVGIFVSKKTTEKNSKLTRFLQLLLLKEGLEVVTIHNFEVSDQLGIPFVICLGENEENGCGIVKIRDRETTWTEEIHLAHIVPRMVQSFQKRIVEDTWTQMCSKYNLK